MTRYLLSVHTAADEPGTPRTGEEMRESYARLGVLEKEMASAGAWVFSGKLHAADTATVVRVADGRVLTTDGPFVEAKEHLGGFYVIEAKDLDTALGWASKVTALIGEVQGPGAALVLVDALDLDDYYPFHAARADLLRRLGRAEEATASYQRAAILAPTEAEREFLSGGGRGSPSELGG